MTWREKLPELEGLPLLPCGAGEKWKAPIDVNTGKPLQNWQNLSFTPEQIMGMNGVVKSVGVRTGPDADNLLILDIDGDTAWEFCQQYNCSKRPGTGWRIWRSNAADRFKVAFQINDQELEEMLDGVGKAQRERRLVLRRIRSAIGFSQFSMGHRPVFRISRGPRRPLLKGFIPALDPLFFGLRRGQLVLEV